MQEPHKKNPDYEWYLDGAINFEPGISCRLKCPACWRAWNADTLKADTQAGRRKNLKFEDVKIILDTFGKIDACGNMSDPIYWPHFEQMLEHTLKLNWQELHIHTNGSGKTLDWWRNIFQKVVDYRKINRRIEDMVVWYFALDGLPEESHKYRINQDGRQVWEVMKMGAEMGCDIRWQYIVFNYNEKHIGAARRMAEQYKHMEFREMHSVRWDDVMAKYKPSDEYTTQKRVTWEN